MRERAREMACPGAGGASGGRSGSVIVVIDSWMMLTRRWNSGLLGSRGYGRGLSSTRPRRPGRGNTTTTRVAISTASSMLCVTMKIELRPFSFERHRLISSWRRFSAVSTSSALKASSRHSSLGCETSARAMPTRWRIPPESSRG